MKITLIILSTLIIITLILKCLKIKRRNKQTHNNIHLPFEIEYIIDSKGKTLQEIQEERRKMQKILIQNLLGGIICQKN